MTDQGKTDPRAQGDIRMADPGDRDIHEPGGSAPYPSSPRGARELYTDGGDVIDPADQKKTGEGGAFEGAHDEGLKEMSEAEYLDWKKGRLQNG